MRRRRHQLRQEGRPGLAPASGSGSPPPCSTASSSACVSQIFQLADPLVGSLIGLIGGIAYYTMLEGGPKGQTLGKMALGIRVIDLARGGPIGYGRGFIRYIGRIASAIVLLLGYLWMLWDPEKQTWHDKFAGSVVVPVERLPRRLIT